MATYEITEGWTGPLDIDLLSQGDTPSGTMSGMSVTLVLKDVQGVAVDTSGDLAIQDSSEWIVRWSPDAADLTPGTYRLRVKVTDGSSKVSYFPSGLPDTLIVRPEA